jgi:predicted ATPase/class 3 adenylate cyclase
MALAAPLPTGAVTFAFTDIEGSTTRWERDRAAMQEAVRRHDAILRAAINEHGGHVFKTIGDAFCAAFAHPEDAIAAMLSAQHVLADEDFSAVDGLRVRMALHTGTTDERDGDYFGPVLNRVARLLAVAHGGQVLISGDTAELSNGIPLQSSLRDLGFAQLKDLATPEHVWQLDIAGLPNEFPPLRTLDALPNNLPLQRTTFVGREHDVAEVKELLEHHRLLTLVGSGGVGKTRLAIQVGADLLDRYLDGVWFVDLARVDNPELVASVVAQTLGMSQRQDQRVDESIPLWLKRKKLLLIFDNCEHVLEPIAALTAAILATAQDVRILATSRQALNISGEAAHSLPSLTVPAETTRLATDEALAYGAIALFVDRARAVDTHFTLTDATAPIVAEICRRLDGIALAIELAAARVKVLSIPNLAQRLDERFRILTGGSRDALPRQKTLTALIDWSYDLLTAQEQMLFSRVGIFAGGFSLDAATKICSGDDLDEIAILDLLSSLTDKSLVVADTSGEHERYRLLESTAAYAREKLAAAGQREAFTRRHAEYFRDHALATEERWGTGSTYAWVAVAELELGNDRAAFEWTLKRGNDAVLGGTIAGALRHVWNSAGLSVEGRYWIELALERVTDAEHPLVAAQLWLALSQLESGQRKYDMAERAMQLYASAADAGGTAEAQRQLGFALWQLWRLDEAAAAFEHALAALRACGKAYEVAACLCLQAGLVMERGDVSAARELYAQALAAFKAVGSESGTAVVLNNLATLEFIDGHPELALRATREALEIYAGGKNAIHPTGSYINIATYQIALGDLSAARDSAREGLRLARQVRDESLITFALERFAQLAALRGDARRSALLIGYVDAQYTALKMQRYAGEQSGYDKLMAALPETLSDDEIAQLTAEGATWSEGQAVEEALKA